MRDFHWTRFREVTVTIGADRTFLGLCRSIGCNSGLIRTFYDQERLIRLVKCLDQAINDQMHYLMHERVNRINRREITTNSTHLILANVFNILFRANIPDQSGIQQIFNAGNGESTRPPLREFITETRNAESFHDRTPFRFPFQFCCVE